MKLHGALAAIALAAVLAGCGKSPSTPGQSQSADEKTLTIGVSFETLQTEFWVAAMDAFKAELTKRNMRMVQAIADGDANRQIEQVKGFITRRVDGIILVPKDAEACIPIIKSANASNIPIVLFNRPADRSEAKSVAVVADNFALTKETVSYMISEAGKTGAKHKAMILIGDLGDINAVGRREGFDAAVKDSPGMVEVRGPRPDGMGSGEGASGRG